MSRLRRMMRISWTERVTKKRETKSQEKKTLINIWCSLYFSTLACERFFVICNCMSWCADRAPVAQWVVHPTHTWLVAGSKHAWFKNTLVFAMRAT